MNNTSVEIELGNGYGYFCNIHDIENQQHIIKIVIKPKQIISRKKLKKINLNEDATDNDHKIYVGCACFVIVIVIAIYVCLL